MLGFRREKEASGRTSSRCSLAPGTRAYGKTSRELQFMYYYRNNVLEKAHGRI